MKKLQGSGPPATPDEEDIPGGFSNPPSTRYGEPGAVKPDDLTYGDWMLRPGKPLSARHKKIAELIAKGASNKQIADLLDYTQARICVLRSNSQIQAEAEKYADRLFSKAVSDSLQELGPDSIRVIEEMINSEKEPLKQRVEAAKWIVEMIGGKAKQQISHEAGSSILDLLRRLDQLAPAGTPEAAREVLELSGGEAKEGDWMETWLNENTGQKSEEKK